MYTVYAKVLDNAENYRLKKWYAPALEYAVKEKLDVLEIL
jgi:hypothetical protein